MHAGATSTSGKDLVRLVCLQRIKIKSLQLWVRALFSAHNSAVWCKLCLLLIVSRVGDQKLLAGARLRLELGHHSCLDTPFITDIVKNPI